MIDGRTRTKTFFPRVVAYRNNQLLSARCHAGADILNRLLVMPAINVASVSLFNSSVVLDVSRRSTMSQLRLNWYGEGGPEREARGSGRKPILGFATWNTKALQ